MANNETSGRVALVTGAANGIGRAIAHRLAGLGMSLIAVDRDRAGLDALRREAGAAAENIKVDVVDFAAEDADRSIAELAGRSGAVDVLVNNAGIGMGAVRNDYHAKPVAFWEVSPAHWRRFFAVNTHPSFLLAYHLAPGMMERKWGRIVNVTTSLGSMLRRGYVPYGPSKAAAESMTACMAKDLDGTGVTANVIVPGGVTNTRLVPEGAFDRAELLQPEIMLPPLEFLLSRDGSKINGRRFVAAHWDCGLPAAAAAEASGAPVGWESLGVLPIVPK